MLTAMLLAAPLALGHPITFEANRGQAARDVLFLARAAGATLFLTEDEAVFRGDGAAVRMSLSRARAPIHPRGEAPSARKSHYFIGDDPTRWTTDVPHYARVVYEGVYPGIDIVFHAASGRLEYDFRVAPGADPEAIELRFDGADAIDVDGRGDLVVRAGASELRHEKPAVTQGTRRLDGGFIASGPNAVRFRIASRDAAAGLVIDPILIYSTLLGTAETDAATDIAVDAFGSAYICGFTTSADFPVKVPLQREPGGSPGDVTAFVAKLTPDGRDLVWSTYLGGSGVSWAEGIAVDSESRPVVVGWSDAADFPKRSPLQVGFGGGTDAFITRLSKAGNALDRSTLYGGSADDKANDVAIVFSGEVVVAGETSSSNFPRVRAIDGTLGGSQDGFLLKTSPALDAVLYATCFGGGDVDSAHAVAVDLDGTAYIAGQTGSGDLPVRSALQGSLKGPRDAFAARIKTDGQDVIYATYLGGGGVDTAEAIAADGVGRAYVAGRASAGFPTRSSLYPEIGSSFIFVTKLEDTGAASVWSTYLGTSVSGFAQGIAVDTVGDVYVTGWAAEFGGVSEFPTRIPLQRTFGGGTGDVFLTRIDSTGTFLRFSSFLGGGQGEEAAGIALLPLSNEVYIAGLAFSPEFPTTLGAFDRMQAGQNDAFVSRVDTNNYPDSPAYLTLDVARPGSLTGAVSEARFRVVVPPGLRLTLTLTGLDPLDWNALYARYNEAAEPHLHDFAADRRGRSGQRLVIPRTRPGELHILVKTNFVNGPSSDVTLLAEASEVALESMAPSRADTLSTVHARIRGGGFADGMKLTLEKPDGTSQVTGSDVQVISPSEAYATFALKGGGLYRLRAQLPAGATAVLDDAFEVTKTLLPGILQVRVVTNDTCRLERHVPLSVEYANVGSREIPAPLLVLSPPGGVGLRLEKDADLPTAEVQLLAVNPSGPAGFLPPGARGSIPLVFRPKGTGAAKFRLSLFAPADSDFIPWATLPAPPGFLSGAWTEALKQPLSGILGASWREYVASLGEIAARLQRRGQYASGARDLFRFAVMEAMGQVPVAVASGELLISPTNAPFANRTVLALENGVPVSSAVTDRRGAFVLPCLEPGGTYDIDMGGGVTSLGPITVPANGDDVLGLVVPAIFRSESFTPPQPCDRNVPLSLPLTLPAASLVTLADFTVNVVGSHDPNEKDGPEGHGVDKLIGANEELLYTVYFENTGTGRAQTVVVTDQLDADLDWTSFRVHEAGVGTHAVSLAAESPTSSTAAIDGYSASRVETQVTHAARFNGAEVRCEFEPLTGLATWTFSTVDPVTGDQPPLFSPDGFLPVNSQPPAGEGWVSFAVFPRPDAPDGTEIKNQGAISFDGQGPVSTQIVRNVIGTAPGAMLPPSNPNPPDDVKREVDIEGLYLAWQGDTLAVQFDISFWKEGEPMPARATASGLTSPWYVPKRTIELGAMYHWQVLEHDAIGKTVKGPTWSFIVEKKPAVAPAAPLLLSPAADATGVSTLPALEWKAAPGAAAYAVWLWQHGAPPPSRPIASGVAGTQLALASPLEDRLAYDWQVEAINESGRTPSAVGTFTVGVPLPSGGFRRGDANASGELDIADPIATLGNLFLGFPPALPCEDAADSNDDGAVDIADPVTTLGHLFLGTFRELPAPFARCGEDPTPDDLRCASFSPCE